MLNTLQPIVVIICNFCCNCMSANLPLIALAAVPGRENPDISFSKYLPSGFAGVFIPLPFGGVYG